MDEEIALEDTVGFFITMNPGYAGRTELPESLKALFRSCAMVVPDLVLICENMLMSEGYNLAKELAKKFVTLYDLGKSLLSKQKHYDWGLRAVKSVLRQAGKLKRQDPNMNENPLLMRALRDFNIPKIITDDKPIFRNLLQDLFPSVEEPLVKTDENMRQAINQVSAENRIVSDDIFSLKVIQLSEILEVRHCVFIIGVPGSGKSTVWKMLINYFKKIGMEVEFDCLDPKAVTSDELFGVLTKSKEFKNGVLSSIIKNQCKEIGKYKQSTQHKWSVLDGDIDPEWIESLNTVMDDNKVLTLVSNDRFPLSPTMRLIFEISNLKNATPATVSRAGVLFINETDIGWKPFFQSWVESDTMRVFYDQNENQDNIIQSVFQKCESYLENTELHRIKHCVPVVDIMMVHTITTIIQDMLQKHHKAIKQKKEEEQKQILEAIFLYAGMWGVGGTFIESGEDEVFFKDFIRIWKS